MKNQVALYLFILLISFNAHGQNKINVINPDTTRLPEGIKFIGKIKAAVRWNDKVGDHIVITTETGETPSKSAPSENFKDAELYAYHYLVGKDSTYLTWKVYDFVKECPLELEARFIKNTFQVTDLNNDGVAEVWLMYKTVCHIDVSPCEMKIIMYQGQQKFVMKGLNKVKVTANEFFGGDYTFDKAFTDGPSVFRDFAKKLWDDNIMQTWEE